MKFLYLRDFFPIFNLNIVSFYVNDTSLLRDELTFIYSINKILKFCYKYYLITILLLKKFENHKYFYFIKLELQNALYFSQYKTRSRPGLSVFPLNSSVPCEGIQERKSVMVWSDFDNSACLHSRWLPMRVTCQTAFSNLYSFIRYRGLYATMYPLDFECEQVSATTFIMIIPPERWKISRKMFEEKPQVLDSFPACWIFGRKWETF